MRHQQIFISGIDTDCGKTFITGLIGYHMRKSGINCITTKLVQTGCVGIAEDIIEHRRIMEMDLLQEDKNKQTCPFVYTFPASPHLSAKIDNHPFNLEEVSQSFESLKEQYDLLLTEGAGGIAVPLNEDLLSTEYAKSKNLPVVLVTSSKLGSINQTLLNIDYCINNNIKLKTIIYNQFPKDDKKIAKSTFAYLKNFLAIHHPKIHLIHGKALEKANSFGYDDLIK